MARTGRTETCGNPEAKTRLAHARKFLEVADIAALETEIDESRSVAVANAVTAGIAAADAACCATLGRRSGGQDHRQAADLVKQIEPGGATAAKALTELLDMKDTAQYGLVNMTSPRVKAALRRARQLIEFAAAQVNP
jgi:hypothetical protein